MLKSLNCDQNCLPDENRKHDLSLSSANLNFLELWTLTEAWLSCSPSLSAIRSAFILCTGFLRTLSMILFCPLNVFKAPRQTYFVPGFTEFTQRSKDCYFKIASKNIATATVREKRWKTAVFDWCQNQTAAAKFFLCPKTFALENCSGQNNGCGPLHPQSVLDYAEPPPPIGNKLIPTI